MTAAGPKRPTAAELTADDIVDAAMMVLATTGLDGVSMRRVAAELGVSPIPLYRHVGNKDALLDAMASRLAADFVLPAERGETWSAYARRWCFALRDRRLGVADSRLLLRGGREPMVGAAAPLIRVLRDQGVNNSRALDAARLLMWSVLGHTAVEVGRTGPGAEPVDTEQVFADHVRYLVDGLERDLT